MHSSSINRNRSFGLFIAYLAFIAYASLIPFELREHSLAEALDVFSEITYLDLDATQRADWIANIVLYVPLAFIGCAWLLGMREETNLGALGLALVFVLCLAAAIALEFSQIFFAPRTVSLNDLLAETIGTLLGITLWAYGRRRILGLWLSFLRGGRESVLAVIIVYGFGYVVLALFPYDFVVSSKELAARLGSDNIG